MNADKIPLASGLHTDDTIHIYVDGEDIGMRIMRNDRGVVVEVNKPLISPTYSEGTIIGNLRRINTRQHKQIREHCETIGGLRATISELEERDALKTTAIDELQKTIKALEADVRIKDRGISRRGEMIDALEAELNTRSADSDALAQVIEVVNNRDIGCVNAMNRIEDIVETHAPEIPCVTNKTIDGLKAELRDEMQQKYVAIRLGAEKAATVLRLNETIGDLRMAASDMLDTINECSRREAEDSMVLMQVVEIVNEWNSPSPLFAADAMNRIVPLVKDHINVVETPFVTLNEVKQHEETITKLKALNDALRIDVADRDRYIEELNVEIKQFRDTIVELRSLVDGTGVITDKQAVTMINNQATTIEEKNTVLRAYREENNDVWSKLERIEKLVDECCMHTNWGVFVDKIKAVIQEE